MFQSTEPGRRSFRAILSCLRRMRGYDSGVAIASTYVNAARKYGGLVDQIASQYTNPVTGGHLTGTALLLKLAQGESGFNPDSVSSVGARGLTQFMPESRQEAISKFHVDPWKDADGAFHAAALHLLGKINGSKGLQGYNPGMASYTDYILGQKVGKVSGSAPARKSSTSPGRTSRPVSDTQPQTTTSTETIAPPASGLSSLIAGLQSQKPVIQSQGLQGPEFSAERYGAGGSLPGGSVAMSQSKTDYAALLTQLQTAAPELQLQTTKTVPGTPMPTTTQMSGGSPQQTSGASRVKGFAAGSPVPGDKRHSSDHPTAGLDGYPAFDYMGKAGAAAVAPVGGRIVRFSGHDPKNGPTNGPHGPFGWSLYLQGNDGKMYYLTHMGSRTVKVGQTVKAGQQIGTIGNYAKFGGANHIHMGVHG